MVMRIGTAILFVLLQFLAGKVGGQDIDTNILYLTGASSMEEISSEVEEHYSTLKQNPIDINHCSLSRLLSCGLLTNYQAVSLREYINDKGEVLSIQELALVDGFGNEFARAISPFIKIRPNDIPGLLKSDIRMIDNMLLTKIGLKNKEAAYGIKYRTKIDDIIEIGAVAKNTYGQKWMPPPFYGGNISFFGKKIPGKLIMGDFNAKFGQGLCLWSGFSMSGLAGIRSVVRSPSGAIPSVSFSDTNLRGLAGDICIGRFSITVLTAFPWLRKAMSGIKGANKEVLPAINMAYTGMNGQISLTATSLFKTKSIDNTVLSIDSRACIKGIDLFAETAIDMINKKPSAIIGTIILVGEKLAFSISSRYSAKGYYNKFSSPFHSFLPKEGELAATLGVGFRQLQFNAEIAENQTNGLTRYRCFMSDLWELNTNLSMAVRLSGKYTAQEKTGRGTARLDIKWCRSALSTNFRTEAVVADKFGILGFCEAGYKDDLKSVYLRTTFFAADSWGSRIYSFERNVPGNFTVPAYCGRGYSISLYASLKRYVRQSALKLYLRGSVTGYPWTRDKKKPGKAELLLQLQYDW